jgi:hypothetical protein
MASQTNPDMRQLMSNLFSGKDNNSGILPINLEKLYFQERPKEFLGKIKGGVSSEIQTIRREGHADEHHCCQILTRTLLPIE